MPRLAVAQDDGRAAALEGGVIVDLARERRVRANVRRLAELALAADPETDGARWADDRLADAAEGEDDDRRERAGGALAHDHD